MKHYTEIVAAPAPRLANGFVYTTVFVVCILFWTAVFGWFLS